MPKLRRNLSRASGKILTNGKKRRARMEKHFHMSLTCFLVSPPSVDGPLESPSSVRPYDRHALSRRQFVTFS